MQEQDLYASFFIRLWRSGKGARLPQDEKMTFEIEHIQSGKIQRVKTAEACLALITTITNEPEASD